MTFIHSPVSYSHSPRSVTDKLLPYKAGTSCKKVINYDVERLHQIPMFVDNEINYDYRRKLSYLTTVCPNLFRENLQNEMLSGRISVHEENLRNEMLSGRISTRSSYQLPQLIPTKKGVSFSTMATVHTRPLTTEVDVSNSWYRDTDYAKFELDRQRTVRRLHSVHKGDVVSLEQTGEYCIFGLERNVSRRSSLQRKYQTMQHSYAVLQQQLANIKNGIIDDISIQAVSEQYSKTTAAELAAREYQRYRMLYEQKYHDEKDLVHVLDQALTVSM